MRRKGLQIERKKERKIKRNKDNNSVETKTINNLFQLCADD